jgi:TrmH family RNA methyltransferase
MDLGRVEVVLLRPARPGNVAAACRAMKNMGLARLRLVDPPAGLQEAEARNLAYGAWDVLDGARTAPSLGAAVAASTFVVGTTGRALEEAWTPRQLAARAAAHAGGGAMSLVFGPEQSGLTNEELRACHARVHIPTSPEHSSLNLAQAVLVLAYELRLHTLLDAPAADPASPVATAGELDRACREMRAALLEIGFLSPANPEPILAELRALVARAAPASREVTLLLGLARQIAWAGRKARERSAIG